MLSRGSRADKMLADLKRAGLKLTPQRIAIVREIADDRSHPTAQALFERLRASFPTMSFATVYATLGALSNCGLTGALTLGPDARAVRFDPNTEPHHHAVCDGCGLVIDIDIESSRSGAAAPPAADHLEGFKVLREERVYRGLCSRCIS